MTNKCSWWCLTLVAALGCERARSASQAGAAGDPHASPEAVTRAWLAAVRAHDWKAIVELVPPDKRPSDEREPPDAFAHMQGPANHVASALAKGPPTFVTVKAVLAEPEHQEWYFCGEPPQNEYFRSPCAVAVIAVAGKWYLLDVDDATEH